MKLSTSGDLAYFVYRRTRNSFWTWSSKLIARLTRRRRSGRCLVHLPISFHSFMLCNIASFHSDDTNIELQSESWLSLQAFERRVRLSCSFKLWESRILRFWFEAVMSLGNCLTHLSQGTKNYVTRSWYYKYHGMLVYLCVADADKSKGLWSGPQQFVWQKN